MSNIRTILLMVTVTILTLSILYTGFIGVAFVVISSLVAFLSGSVEQSIPNGVLPCIKLLEKKTRLIRLLGEMMISVRTGDIIDWGDVNRKDDDFPISATAE